MTISEQPDKLYIDANSLLNDAFLLGEKILDSGFRPDLLVALWRGGTPVAVAVQELLACRGLSHNHYPVKTRHYAGIEQPEPEIHIEGLEPVLAHIGEESRLLIVDDVFDTGLTLDKLVRVICRRTGIPRGQVKVATVWFKPGSNRTDWKPDFHLRETERWIVFPHELQGLSEGEIRQHKAPQLPALRMGCKF